jgi:nucleotide-binding universal stress UspA family protein
MAERDGSSSENKANVFTKILLGYASDQAGRDAVRFGSRLAAVLRGQAIVVFPFRPLLSRVTSEVAEQRVRQEVSALTADVEGFATSYRWMPDGWPIHALHELAEYEHAQLIVFGSHRAGLAAHLQLSMMERMVHSAPCAVAVVPPNYADSAAAELARIGIGFSASTEGRAALRLAHGLAALTGGSLVVIAGAWLEPALAGYASSSGVVPSLDTEIYEETKTTVEQWTSDLGDDVPIQRETLSGDPATLLIERSRDLDLLVLGSRAYGPLRHALLGSVSARVMREAHSPVVVVPRGIDVPTTPVED